MTETTEHDGKKRRMVEIAPGHFVRATEDEIPIYTKRAVDAGLITEFSE
ncbi:hypothetical protein S101258_01211 [Lactiplantibacillus plantarum subsp. plantarum]|uniref:Uncharacterized protein n=1 Tax=Lactiplantibacillus plantarum subsp. plantarum TaxID=337330 RepID=A0A2S3U6W8_LACPN|nr:hypothetical protein S101258_01211 [Lactiplantibacillus plantarum subsp. plantarum]